MNAPFVQMLSSFGFVVTALILGFFFGFFLERAGFSSARKLTDQFYFRDFAVLKVMFTAIVLTMLGIAYLTLLGWMDAGQLYVPPTLLWPQLFGGILLGAGFIVGGYCPGTSVVAAAIGKLDGLMFVIGVLIGTWGLGVAVPYFQGFYLSGSMGELTLPRWLNVNVGMVVFAVTLIALGASWAAERCEGRWQLFARTYGRYAGGEGEGHEG